MDDEITENRSENGDEVAIYIGACGAEFAEGKGPKRVGYGAAKHAEANQRNDVLADLTEVGWLEMFHHHDQGNEIEHSDYVLHPSDSQWFVEFRQLDERDGIAYCH